jgi:hypothetical protein
MILQPTPNTHASVIAMVQCIKFDLILHRSAFYNLNICTSFDRNTTQFSTLKLIDNLLHSYPFNPFVTIDPLNQPLVQQQHLRLPADLRMDTDREHKATIFGTLPVKVLKLLFPKPLNDCCVDESVRRSLRERKLKRRPVVQVPVCRDFYHGRGLEGAHWGHPIGGRFRDVGLCVRGKEGIGEVVRLRVMVHE